MGWARKRNAIKRACCRRCWSALRRRPLWCPRTSSARSGSGWPRTKVPLAAATRTSAWKKKTTKSVFFFDFSKAVTWFFTWCHRNLSGNTRFFNGFYFYRLSNHRGLLFTHSTSNNKILSIEFDTIGYYEMPLRTAVLCGVFETFDRTFFVLQMNFTVFWRFFWGGGLMVENRVTNKNIRDWPNPLWPYRPKSQQWPDWRTVCGCANRPTPTKRSDSSHLKTEFDWKKEKVIRCLKGESFFLVHHRCVNDSIDSIF